MATDDLDSKFAAANAGPDRWLGSTEWELGSADYVDERLNMIGALAIYMSADGAGDFNDDIRGWAMNAIRLLARQAASGFDAVLADRPKVRSDG